MKLSVGNYSQEMTITYSFNRN